MLIIQNTILDRESELPAKPSKSSPTCTKHVSRTKARSLTPSSEFILARLVLCHSSLCSHYDVEINPVVKVANQKKPRALLWEVWLQLLTEVNGDAKKVLDAGAYDMV